MKTLVFLTGLVFFAVPVELFSHERIVVDSHHSEPDLPKMAEGFRTNQLYLQNVRPIFKAKCFDCHSDQTRYPWYYRLPGIKQLIDDDIKEAREHMDLSHDFPFGGHHSPKEQLKDLKEVVAEDKMPLWRYRLLHWNSGLTDEEKRIILEWLEKSR